MHTSHEESTVHELLLSTPRKHAPLDSTPRVCKLPYSLSFNTFYPRPTSYVTSRHHQRYRAIIRALPHGVFISLSSFISTFRQATLYDELKVAIISAHGMTPQQYLKVLEDMQLDVRRPCKLLLLNEATMPFNNDILKGRHAKLLPTTIQLHLQAQPNLLLRE
ncbi:hypothetical protein Pmani_009213 [Petrolisthes manimaculis]|uniref:Uncharacterized protein n=1 Tax=Petrolisthes manimaculis TaxID=1843537 RepID=A0AAE1Q6U8_9EUCA|nr:hypothetical protein Pmani_009213 [Petrolisthes manimaculis]